MPLTLERADNAHKFSRFQAENAGSWKQPDLCGSDRLQVEINPLTWKQLFDSRSSTWPSLLYNCFTRQTSRSDSPAWMAAMVGKTIAHYQILEKLGEGRWASLMLAQPAGAHSSRKRPYPGLIDRLGS